MKLKYIIGMLALLVLAGCSKGKDTDDKRGEAGLTESDYLFMSIWDSGHLRDGDKLEAYQAYIAARDNVEQKLGRIPGGGYYSAGNGCALKFSVLTKKYNVEFVDFMEENCQYGADLGEWLWYSGVSKNLNYVDAVLDGWSRFSLYDNEGQDISAFQKSVRGVDTSLRLDMAKKFFAGYTQEQFEQQIGGHIFNISYYQKALFLQRLHYGSLKMRGDELFRICMIYDLNSIFSLIPVISPHKNAFQSAHQEILDIFASGGSFEEVGQVLLRLRALLLTEADIHLSPEFVKMVHVRIVAYIDVALMGLGVINPNLKGTEL